MQEGYNKPSFGIFILRVVVIALALFLLGFIIWGVMKLADSSDFWGDFSLTVGGLLTVILIGVGIWFLVRFLRTNSINLNIGRILGLVGGLLLLGLIVWGVFKLADTSDSEGTVDVADNGSSTITIDGGTDQPSTEGDSSDLAVEDNGEQGTEESGQETGQSSQQTAPAADSSTPSTGPTPEAIPNTGIESAILPALSLGALAYAARSYKTSRQQLKQI